jgi:hypothetical protein
MMSVRPAHWRIAAPWSILFGSVFLVSVPVLFQASLVRWVPEVSLALTLGWLLLAWQLWRRSRTKVWGDLLVGFSWTWLAGSIYWGWMRWEPLWHLPLEAIALPLAVICLLRRQAVVGSWFYLGSLFGTVVTDVYFYLCDVIPAWRQVMLASPDALHPIFQNALARVTTPWGLAWGLGLVLLLLGVGLMPLQIPRTWAWAFGGAVLSTLLVDGLFLIAAIAA